MHLCIKALPSQRIRFIRESHLLNRLSRMGRIPAVQAAMQMQADRTKNKTAHIGGIVKDSTDARGSSPSGPQFKRPAATGPRQRSSQPS